MELFSFTAVKHNQGGLVSWETASEKNADHFEVEGSRDGAVFSTIGTVKAAGVSAETRAYAFTDDRVLSGIYYYRLKTVDLDGRFEYSKTVSIDFATALTIQAYPNPLKEELRIDVGLDKNAGDIDVEIFDVVGRLTYQNRIPSGKENLHLTIATAGFAPGAYIVRVKSKDHLWRQKITKL